MREPGQHDWWTVVGVAGTAVSVPVAIWMGLKYYVVCGFSLGAILKVLLLTRWSAPWARNERQDWFYVILWPASLLGLYWVVKKGEENRRERIVREVMES